MNSTQQLTSPPSYEQACIIQPEFPEAKGIKSITKSITSGNGSQSLKFQKIQFPFRFSKLCSTAISISKYGIAGVKNSSGPYGCNQISIPAQQDELQSTCSHTTGISKYCRGCEEGERCNQLGSPRNRRTKQVTQYTLNYSYSEEQHKEQQKALENIDDSTVFL